MEENEQFEKYIDETLTEEYITELREKAAKKLNRQILFRSILRWLVGIAIGIISAKQEDWLAIINMGGMYIVVEALWFFIYLFRLKYEVESFQSAFNFANKIVWRQVFMSAVFIGAVAVITKLIAGIFI